jgi:dihydrolipoamide dehydrogenase
MLGPAVEHLAHLLAHAIGDGKSAAAVQDQPIYHPTVEEGFSTALSEITQSICQS